MNILLEAGAKLAVIGPNGIGKTTFLKTIMGDVSPKSGFTKFGELKC